MMTLTTQTGRVVDIDPFDQGSIDAARAGGECVGVAVAEGLVEAARAGQVTSAEELPEEYRRLLGRLIFGSTSQSKASD